VAGPGSLPNGGIARESIASAADMGLDDLDHTDEARPEPIVAQHRAWFSRVIAFGTALVERIIPSNND